MYEVLEHWKQYKLDNEAKELQKKISQEYKLNEKNKNLKEFDKWLNELAKKYGTTKY